MKFLVVLLVLALSYVNGQKAPTACTYNGINYSAASNGSYSSTSTDNQYRFYWNVCGTATQCGNANSGIAACQIKIGSTAVTNVGNLASGAFKTANGNPSLYYTTNASPCSGGIYRSMLIQLKCGNGATIATSVAEDSKCTYDVTMTGKSLCGGSTPAPDHSGSSSNNTDSTSPKKNFIGGGWIFIIILLSCTVVYIIGGVIFNAKVKHQHGSDMFPNKEMWVNFGGLIKDGVFFIKSKVTGTQSGYQQV